jgi:hypothetical protein
MISSVILLMTIYSAIPAKNSSNAGSRAHPNRIK